MDEQTWQNLKFWAGGRWADLAREMGVSSELVRQWRKNETPVAQHQLVKLHQKFPRAFSSESRQ